MNGYKFCDENALVTPVQSEWGWYAVLIDGQVACSMATGGCMTFGKRLDAEVFGNNLVRGYNRGIFLSSDLDNYLTKPKVVNGKVLFD